MGFLESLWDETLAGPAPGRLRRFTTSPPIHGDDDVLVTRSITIVRTTPSSALLPGTSHHLSPRIPSADFKKLTRRKPDAEPSQQVEPRRPTVYDWILISALDR